MSVKTIKLKCTSGGVFILSGSTWATGSVGDYGNIYTTITVGSTKIADSGNRIDQSNAFNFASNACAAAKVTVNQIVTFTFDCSKKSLSYGRAHIIGLFGASGVWN